jgi:AcrR family transcriptional regulator
MPAPAKNDAQKRAPSLGRRSRSLHEVKRAATHVFYNKGIAGTSLGDVAAELGMVRTALYHYYRSKDELLVALITECARDGRQVLAESRRASDAAVAIADRSSAAQLRDAVFRLATLSIEQPERVRILDAAAELPPQAKRTAKRLNHLFFSDLSALIQMGIDNGAFRTVDAGVAAHAIVGATRSLAWWFDPAGLQNASFVAGQIADTALHGLLADHWKQAPASVVEAAARLQDDVEALVKNLKVEHHDGPCSLD